MKEEWKEIEGYSGVYQVSNLGRVRNAVNGKVLKLMGNGTGYLYVGLYADGRRKNHYVHRLVALAYLHNREGKPCVNHIDSFRSNNVVSNLEWCSYSENTLHGYSSGGLSRVGIKNPQAKLDDEKVATIKKIKSSEEGLSIANIAKMFSVSPSTISDILNGRTWSHITIK